MKARKKSVRDVSPTGSMSESRRKFLKQSIAFMAVTATYSVVSLTDLACNSSVPTSYNTNDLTYFHFGSIYY